MVKPFYLTMTFFKEADFLWLNKIPLKNK